MIIVNGWKPLTVITKSSILDTATALDPPLMNHLNHIRIKWYFKDTRRENRPSNEIKALTKSMNLSIWEAGTLNQLFVRDFYAEIKI